MADLDFGDLAPREASVDLRDGKSYVLKEASAGAAAAYRNAVTRGMRFEGGKPAGIDSAADAEPLLVSLCLFEVQGEKRVPVPLQTVRAWPYRVQRKLFDWVKENSLLDDQETAESLEDRMAALRERLESLKANGGPAKNSHAATTGPSA